MNTDRVAIRQAGPEDAPRVLEFIRELAEYERLSDKVTAEPADIAGALSDGRVGVILALVDGEPAGFALYFFNFSTFVGRSGLYLEDLFVQPAHRGLGIGRRLLESLAAIALDHGAERMDWAVLDWNAPAIAFYERLGATHQDDWLPFRLEGEPLKRLAMPAMQSDYIMSEDNLEELLSRLNAEIGSGEGLSADQRAALAKMHESIEAALASPASAADPVEVMRAYVEELEDSHPTLTLTLGRIMDALNKMGI